jgi:hypothetical protein
MRWQLFTNNNNNNNKDIIYTVQYTARWYGEKKKEINLGRVFSRCTFIKPAS